MSAILKHVKEQAQKMANIDREDWVVVYDHTDKTVPYTYGNHDYIISHPYWRSKKIIIVVSPKIQAGDTCPECGIGLCNENIKGRCCDNGHDL